MFYDGALGIRAFPRSLFRNARKEFHVKDPPTDEGAMKEDWQLRRDAQKFCAALRIIERQPEYQAGDGGKNPPQVMAHHAPLDGTTEKPYARADNHARIVPMFHDLQHWEQFFERCGEIGIPECHVGGTEEDGMEETSAHCFGLPAIPRESENGECAGMPVIHALQHRKGAVGTAVIHKEKADAGKPRGEGDERSGIQPPLFIETWHNHRDCL